MKISIIFFFCFILLLPTCAQSESISFTKDNIIKLTRDPFITYDSMLILDFDASAVNNAEFIPGGPTVSIPITIQYQVFVPDKLINNLILRWLFLQTFIVTNAQIHLEVVDPPDWAAISFSNPSPYIPIDTEPQETSTTLQIAIHEDAQIKTFTIRIEAESDSVLNNHVPGKDVYLDIIGTICPYLDIDVEIPHPIVEAEPNRLAESTIEITNTGNIESTITPKIITDLPGWETFLFPKALMIRMNEMEKLYLYVVPPTGFSGLQTVDLSLEVKSHLLPDLPTLEEVVNVSFYSPG
jgi:hypothetical protein